MVKILRGRAPLRISFCGGGTDVPPYPTREGGLVLNSTISLFVHASIHESDKMEVISTDFEMRGPDRLYTDRLEILRAVCSHLRSKKRYSVTIYSNYLSYFFAQHAHMHANKKE